MRKRKPKVIHVDKLIIKANDVTIQHDPKENSEEQSFFDPWGFDPVNEFEQQPESETEADTSSTTSEEEDQSGWSWI